ncbi:MAG: 16S rRNA (uracil(1498)-N(3))-methyltransferase [Alphaproteobacteria bacterium]
MARSLRRFYAEFLPAVGRRLTLHDDEAHHMVNVVRVRTGDEMRLFDGNGTEARARLIEGRRREAVLEILSCERIDREPARKLTLACALPRATRMDFLVEKCCELGVERLIPMVTQRSVVDPSTRQKNHQRRWKRAAIEASKQCGRTRLTDIGSVLPFNAAVLAGEVNAIRLIASPANDAIPINAFIAEKIFPGKPLFALIGPEGGFTDDEVALARDTGCAIVSLGPRILRVETAAVALAARLLLGE